MSTIQAIHVATAGTTSDVLALTKVQAPTIIEPFDIIVRVKAVSLNPADPKVRKNVGKILGYDASGIVETAGPQALFQPGDAVLYAGAIARPGSNAELQLVDSRIAARKPASLAWDDAAAIPLVGLTAWEMLAEKFHLVPGAKENAEHVLLVVGAAGGVGTMAMQLATKVFGINRVIATASRPETIDWVKKFGATDVINHHEPLAPQLAALNVQPSLVFLNHSTSKYFKDLVPAMRAFGHIGSIVETDGEVIPVHEGPVMQKALSYSWELMFSKTIFGYRVESQGEILAKLAQLAESGVLPVSQFVTGRHELSVKTLREGHDLVEAGKAIGKIVYTVPEGTWN